VLVAATHCQPTAATLLGVELPAPLVRKIKKAAKTFEHLEVADDGIVGAVRLE
jgi:hypothetical protein